MKRPNLKGFTLIELLVVIAIIGLLSTLAVVALNSARQKSRDSKRVADVKQIQTALELYFADENGYPVEATAVTLGGASDKVLCAGDSADGFLPVANGAGGCDADSTPGATVYMGLVPAAPTPADSTCGTGGTLPSNNYLYTAAASSTYTLTFCLGGKVGDLAALGHTASPNGIQ